VTMRRRWFHFHFSTAVFAFVLASVLVGCAISEIRNEDEGIQCAMDVHVRRALRSDLDHAIPMMCLRSIGVLVVSALAFEYWVSRRGN